MKKFLSIILACAMIMSLFCVVPVSAAVTSGAYMFEDFESGNSTFITGFNIESNPENVYEGSYSAKKTDKVLAGKTTAAYGDNQDLQLPASFYKALVPGDIVRVSFKYKLTYPLAQNSKFCVVTSTIQGGAAKYPGTNVFVANPGDTENWQDFVAEFTVPADATQKVDGSYLGLFYIRISNTANGGLKVATAPEVDTQVGIYFDNVTVEKVLEQNDATETIVHDGVREVTCGSQGSIKGTALDPFGTGNPVYEVAPSGGNLSYNFAKFTPEPISAGDRIDISIKVAIERGASTTQPKNARYNTLRILGKRDADEITIKGWQDTSVETAGDETLASLLIPMGGTEWHTVSASYTHEGDPFNFTGTRINVSDHTASSMSRVYFDDWTVTITRADASLSKTPVVTDLVAEVNEEGAVTADYTLTKGAGDATDGTDASVYKLKNANGAVIASGLVSELAIPEGLNATDLTLEIVPVTSTGYIGAPVACAITEAEEEVTPIVGTYFDNLAGNLTLSSGTAIENAKIIFVTYDANGKMVDFDVVSDVDVAVNGTINVAPTKVLNAGTKSVVMLWQDMIKCVPLADALAY